MERKNVPSSNHNSAHVGLIGVVLIIVAVFAVFSFALYTLRTVFDISIPYPEITIIVTWAVIALVGVLVLGHTFEVFASHRDAVRSREYLKKLWIKTQ